MEDVVLDVLGPALYTLSFAFSSLLLIVEAAAPFQVPCLTYWLASCLAVSLCKCGTRTAWESHVRVPY